MRIRMLVPWQIAVASLVCIPACLAVGFVPEAYRGLHTASEGKLEPFLSDAVTRPEFRYFHVNLDRHCPFWVQHIMCGSAGPATCSICKCEPEEVPRFFASSVVRSDMDVKDEWISDSLRNVCDPQSPDGTWVDLTKNPESNTGFSGPDAYRVWNAIYSDNCFACGDEAFFRLVSGLHHSITTHIARNYRDTDVEAEAASRRSDSTSFAPTATSLPAPQDDPGDILAAPLWGRFLPNRRMFLERVDPFNDRLENMLFAYSVLLQAIHRYATSTKHGTDSTDPAIGSLRIIADMVPKEYLMSNKTVLQFSNLEKIRGHFRNITDILDCIACEKCKLWSKVQFLGLASALRILTAASPAGEASVCLTPNELVALVNTARELSRSIRYIQDLRLYLRSESISPYIGYLCMAFCLAVILRLWTWRVRPSRRGGKACTAAGAKVD